MKTFMKTKLSIKFLLMVIAMAFTGCYDNGIIESNENQKLNEPTAFAAAAPLAPLALGIDPARADAAINGFNNAFLVRSGGRTFYKTSLSNGSADGFWTLALDIQGMEDAYERTRSAEHRTLVNDLCTSFLQNNAPPYSWDGWNDDIAWVGLMLARGYQITGTANLRTQAEYCFNFVYNRGWDTQYNGGGIWEQQPNMTPAGEPINKEALSNNSTGKLGCMLYQMTGNQEYLTKAQRIYDWSWSHLFDANTGQVFTGIDRNNVVNKGTAVYNQGTFIDFAAILYKITGNGNVFRDAQRATDFVRNNLTNNGIITNNAGYLNTWADEFARGLGHLCQDNPQLWNTYGDWMVQNANAIWNNRRTDYNVTWNGWDQPTTTANTLTPTKCVSAVAWLQFTPKSGGIISGTTYSIISKSSGKAMDVKAASTADGANVQQWTDGRGANQRWVVASVGNNAYSITAVHSNKCLDLAGGSSANGTNILQWGWNGGDNQRWLLQPDGQGYYTIVSVASGRAIDVDGGSATNGANVLQWNIHGGDNQKWSFVP